MPFCSRGYARVGDAPDQLEAKAMTVLRIALDVPLATLFDYAPPEDGAARVGDRVVVPFGTRSRVGVVVEEADSSKIDAGKLKRVARVLEDVPRLPVQWLELMRFLAVYYQRPLGETVVGSLPPRLRSLKPLPKKVREGATVRPVSARFVSHHVPSPAQAHAIDRIGGALGAFRAFLLHGVTGSGKTEVYLRLISRVLERGGQALVMVPEISLTPQLEARFRDAFPEARVALLHSALQDVPRTSAWLSAA
ncbi:MAG TPA: DEAD/DEAH box helicase family protein, partial [Burkholderiales bacterium]